MHALQGRLDDRGLVRRGVEEVGNDAFDVSVALALAFGAGLQDGLERAAEPLAFGLHVPQDLSLARQAAVAGPFVGDLLGGLGLPAVDRGHLAAFGLEVSLQVFQNRLDIRQLGLVLRFICQ